MDDPHPQGAAVSFALVSVGRKSSRTVPTGRLIRSIHRAASRYASSSSVSTGANASTPATVFGSSQTWTWVIPAAA